MKKNTNKFLKAYQKASTETASPGQVILMLYNGALKFLNSVLTAFEESTQSHLPIELVNNNIFKTQQIIAELKGALDLSVEGALPKALYDLYGYMEIELSKANIKKDPAPIKIVYRQLKELRDAWEQMLINFKNNDDQKTHVSDEGPTSLSCSA